MFWKRKPKAPPPPADPELEALRAGLARRRETVAELEQELFDVRRFTAEVEAYLLPLQSRRDALRTQLAQARGGQWTPASRFTEAAPEPAQTAPAAEPLEPAAEADLKALFRALAKRFHPDLAAAPAEKARRQAVMAQVNAAYAAQDLKTLQELATLPELAAEAPASRAAQLAELRAESERLDGVIAGLEGELDGLADTPAVQLKLEVSLARQRGHNLLGQIAAELEAEIARLEAELAGLRRGDRA